MTTVRVRDKHQITLPAALVRAANIHANDILEIDYRNGVITLTTTQAQTPSRSLMHYAGSAEGLYGDTAEEVHNYLETERASWER